MSDETTYTAILGEIAHESESGQKLRISIWEMVMFPFNMKYETKQECAGNVEQCAFKKRAFRSDQMHVYGKRENRFRNRPEAAVRRANFILGRDQKALGKCNT